jgi:hypothetical protein
MVSAQLIGTILGIIFNTGTAFFVMDMMPDLHLGTGTWKMSSQETFLSAAGIWGCDYII